MSVVQNPLIGRARQKIGGSVFTTWKGINVLKGKPLTVANPNSINQQMRRSALRQMVHISRVLYQLTFYGFRQQAVKKSQTNAFVGYNLRNSFDYSAPPAATLTPATVLVSQGTITPTPMTTVVIDKSAATVTPSWDGSTTDPGQSPTDFGLIAVYNEDTDEWWASSLSAVRTANTAVVPIPTAFITTGDTCHVYVFFVNSIMTKSSDNSYNSTVVVA